MSLLHVLAQMERRGGSGGKNKPFFISGVVGKKIEMFKRGLDLKRARRLLSCIFAKPR